MNESRHVTPTTSTVDDAVGQSFQVALRATVGSHWQSFAVIGNHLQSLAVMRRHWQSLEVALREWLSLEFARQ